MRRVHRLISFISWGALFAAFIHLCLKWSSMPEVTGVHFAGDGNFDVFASKKFIAYPFIVGIVFLLLIQLGDRAARKARLGVKMNKDGESIFRELIRLLLDTNKLFIGALAVYWVELVIYQHKMVLPPVIAAMMILFVMFISLCITVPVLKIYYPISKKANP